MFHANFHGDFFNLAKITCRLCLARSGRVLGGLRRLHEQVTPVALRMSLSAAILPLSSHSCLGFLSHDGFISALLLLILSSSFSCLAYQRRFVGQRAGTRLYEVISQSGTTLIISHYVLARKQGCLGPLNNQISPLNTTKSCYSRDVTKQRNHVLVCRFLHSPSKETLAG